jgi:hypothetical protein
MMPSAWWRVDHCAPWTLGATHIASSFSEHATAPLLTLILVSSEGGFQFCFLKETFNFFITPFHQVTSIFLKKICYDIFKGI